MVTIVGAAGEEETISHSRGISKMQYGKLKLISVQEGMDYE